MGWEQKRGLWRLGSVTLSAAIFAAACADEGERVGSGNSALRGDVVSNPAATGFVMVTHGTGLGSGTLLRNGDFVLTAAHVPEDRYCRLPDQVDAGGCVFDVNREAVQTGSKDAPVETRFVHRISVHPQYAPTVDHDALGPDVAILQLDAPITGVPTFNIAPSSTSEVDAMDLDCFGFGLGDIDGAPSSRSGILRTGTFGAELTGVQDQRLHFNMIDSDFAFLSGDSGGPCLKAVDGASVEAVISNHVEATHADAFFFWGNFVTSSVGDYVTDADGDELPDAVFATEDLDFDLNIAFQKDGTASTLEDMGFSPFSFDSTTHFRLAVGDFNGDDLLDYLAVSDSDTRLVLGPDTVVTSRLPAGRYHYVRVLDADGDGLDDVEVLAEQSNTEGLRLTMLGYDGGLRTPALAFAHAEFNGTAGDDLTTITLKAEQGQQYYYLNYRPGTGSPFDATTLTFAKYYRPTKLLRGSFNRDALDDLVLMVDGHLFNYSGAQAALPVYAGTPRYTWLDKPGEVPFVDDIHVIPGPDGEGHDFVEASMSDGTVQLWEGRSGSRLLFLIDELGGFPSAFGEDGKMLVVSGEGFNTVAAAETRLKVVSQGSENDRLFAQIYDGEIGGFHDHGGEGVFTCVHLATDPCGDRQVGDCELTPDERRGTILHSWDSRDFELVDNSWTTLVDPLTGDDVTNDCRASAKAGCAGPFVYELRVFLSVDDCDQPPAPGEQVEVPTINAFKVRSNGVISHPVGQLSVRGTDSNGDFGIPFIDYMRNTSFDGELRFPFAGALAANGITLTESDADDIDDQTHFGTAVGANSSINYRLFNPNNETVVLTPVPSAEASANPAIVDNPSGNCNAAGGDGACDVEVRTAAAISTQEPLSWVWRGVSAHNTIQVFSPFGSPPTYEMMGSLRRRAVISPVLAPSAWAISGATAGLLPVVLGSTDADGNPEGTSVVVSDESSARALLQTNSSEPFALLLREALAAKLNIARAAAFGERLAASSIYATTASLRESLQAAESAIRGPRSLVNLDQVRRVTTLLYAANLGDVTYIQPGVPIPSDLAADDDDDSIINAKDNCPSQPNTDQSDVDRDGVGDACRVNPNVHCVFASAPGHYRALLGYDSPLAFRALPVGRRNHFSGPLEDRGQPSVFTGGIHDVVFSVDFESPITWTLEDTELKVSADLPGCSGRNLASVPFAQHVALFGTDGVTLHQGAQVIHSGGFASVVSGGPVDVGTKAALGAIWARGDVDVHNKAQVKGTLVSGGDVSAHHGASITLPIEEHAFVPKHDIGWVVDFTGGDDIKLHGGSAQRSPGSYGDVRLEKGATLSLGAGVYYFDSLVMASGSELVLSGATFIYVKDDLDLDGRVRDASGSTPQLLLGYFGREAVKLKSRFVGTLVAPNAEIQLWSASGGHLGAFFGRRVLAHSNAVVEFLAPLAP